MADGDNVDADGVQVRAVLDKDGRFEYGDPVPMAPPVDFRPPPTMIEMIRQFVKREMSVQAEELGFETFEEADDFDVVDEFGNSELDRLTPYEAVFEPPLPEQRAAVEGMTGKRAPKDAASQAPAVVAAAPPPPASASPTTLNDASQPTETIVKRSESS